MMPDLFMEETGNPDGVPILFIHGGGGANWTWEEVTPYLKDYRCILPDLQEHGKTGLSAGDFSISSSSLLLAQLIRDRIPAGKAHVVGLSIGAQIVADMLAVVPDVIESAIISSAQLLPMPGDQLGIYSETFMAPIYWMGIAPFKKCDPWIRINMKYAAGIPDRYFQIFKENFQTMTRNAWTHVMVENFRFRLPAGMERVHALVLLLAGIKEYGSIHDSHKLLADLIPDNQAFLVGANKNWSMAQDHNWPMNDPQLFAETVKAWVSGKSLPKALKLMKSG